MGESRIQGDGDRPAGILAYCTLLCPSLLYHLSPVLQLLPARKMEQTPACVQLLLSKLKVKLKPHPPQASQQPPNI